MSIAKATTDECKHCESEIDNYYAPGYCSEECYFKHQADNALNVVRHDHRLCATCMSAIKEVEPPSEEWTQERGSSTQVALKHGAEYHNVDDIGISLDATECYRANPTSVDSVIGYQYRKPEAVTVVKDVTDSNGRLQKETTGTGCTCGQTDPSVSDNDLKDVDPAQVLANYVKLFRYLERTGKTNHELDKDVFFEVFKETRDWDLALGKAIQ